MLLFSRLLGYLHVEFGLQVWVGHNDVAGEAGCNG